MRKKKMNTTKKYITAIGMMIAFLLTKITNIIEIIATNSVILAIQVTAVAEFIGNALTDRTNWHIWVILGALVMFLTGWIENKKR